MAAQALHYDVGDVAVVDVTFAVGGTNTNPTNVTAKTRKPDGTITTYTFGVDPQLGRSATGVYFLEIACDQPGYWWYGFQGDEPAPGTTRGLFVVDPSPFDVGYPTTTGALCTLEDVKTYLGEDPNDRTWDLLFLDLIDEVSLAIRNHTRREFVKGTEATARFFDAVDLYDRRSRELRIGDLSSITDVAVQVEDEDGTLLATIPASQLTALPRVRESWRPIRRLRFHRTANRIPGEYDVVKVTGIWGFPEVPADVHRYAVIQVAEWFARDVAKFSTTFDLAEGRIVRPRAISAAIADGLNAYRIPAVG